MDVVVVVVVVRCERVYDQVVVAAKDLKHCENGIESRVVYRVHYLEPCH